MPQIGPMEILVVGVLALMVFGPEKLPGMARSAGKALNQVKKMASEAKSEFDMSLDDEKAKHQAQEQEQVEAKQEAVPTAAAASTIPPEVEVPVASVEPVSSDVIEAPESSSQEPLLVTKS